MQYELFSDADFQQELPLEGRAVCLLGTFRVATKTLQKKLQALGAEIKNGVSRNVHAVVLGQEPSADQLERLRLLRYNGFCPTVLTEADLDDILQGHYASHPVPATISKQLRLTHEHFQAAQLQLPADANPLYTRELYLAPDIPSELYQRLGNRGIYANTYIDDTTDVLVISDATLARLEQGQTDDTLRYIEQQYNKSRAQSFRYVLASEGQLRTWLSQS